MKQRFDNLDLLKTLAMLMVVSLHIPVWYPDFITDGYVTALPQYALRLAMEGVPLFVMVNGFLLFNKKEIVLQTHFKKIGKLALLLVIWSFLLIIGGLLTAGREISCSMLWTYFLQTKVDSTYTGVLWFLQNLIALYFVMPILKKVYDNDYPLFKVFFFLVAFFTVGVQTMSMLIDFIQPILKVPLFALIPEYLNRFNFIKNGEFVLFAMLGGILLKEKEHFLQKRKWWVAAGIGAWGISLLFGVIISEISQNLYNPIFNYSSICMPIMMIGWYAATLKYQNSGKWYHKIIRSIGENTLGIYFLHTFVIHIVEKIIPYDSLEIRVLQWGLVYLASWIGSAIMKKLPLIKELVI